MPGHRLIILLASVSVLTVAAHAASSSGTSSPGASSSSTPSPGSVPLPRQRPSTAAGKAGKTTAAKPAAAKTAAQKSGTPQAMPLSLGPSQAGAPPPIAPALRGSVPLAAATTASTSPMDISAVKQAIDLVRKNRQDEATGIESSISDPLARKLVEWVVLRSEDGSSDFSRYASFISANPSWPSIATLRRRAEAVMWQQHADPQSIIAFFANEQPHSAKGHFALARALMARGDSAGAAAALRDSWRSDGFSADLEAQVRAEFAGLITPADDEVRMAARLYAEDDDAGLRAARHLDATALAIAKARAAVINQAANTKALLEEVPESARHDPGYMFSRIQWLRRADKITEAAQWMVAVPRDPAKLIDPDQWWIERRLIARKLLDQDEAKTAYEVASGAAPPVNENLRGEQQFTSGWIALRFLHQPSVAIAHFARIADGVSNPITLARSYYWQGRAAEAAGHEQDAAAYYQQAAHYPTAYYGQLARARLNLDEVTLRARPESTAAHRTLEVARAFEILYAIDERDLIATMAADLGDKSGDTAALAALAEITTHHNDARATLLIGKSALSHGFPFELYAFPDFGVPDYQQIGPQVEPCVVYSIVRQESAFNPRVVSSANAIGLMQVTPAAGRDTAKQIQRHFRSTPAQRRRRLQRAARQRGARQRHCQLARLLYPGLCRLQRGTAPLQGVDRAIRRPA